MYTAARDQAEVNPRRIHSTKTEMIEADPVHIKAARQAIHSAMKVAATEILDPIGILGTKIAEIENYLGNKELHDLLRVSQWT